MATSRAQFEATVKADTSGAVAEFNRAGASIDKAMDRASKSTERLDNAMVKMARGAVGGVAFGQIVQFSKQLVNSTAQLEDTIAAAGVTFGEYADQIEKFGQSAAKNFGISQRAAIDAANNFAALGKSAGLTGGDLAEFSTVMVGLAGDLASFRGTSVEDAIGAIGSGLRGEAEPLRRFGILLDDATLKATAMAMGIYEGEGALTAQQKVLAAQVSILKQSGDAQGDFARTADSTANSLKTASAEMENAKAAAGEALAPAMTALAQAVLPVLDGFGALPSELQTVITLSGLSAGAFSSASSSLQALGVATKTANIVMGALVGTIGIAATGYAIYAQQKEKAARQTEAFVDALNKEGPEQDSALMQLAKSDKDFRQFIDALNDTGLTIADVEQYATAGTGAFRDYFGKIAEYGGMARGGPGRLARELGVSEEAFIRVISAVSDLRGNQIELAGTTNALRIATDGHLASENYRAQGLRDVAAAADEATVAIRGSNGETGDAIDLVKQHSDAILKYIEVRDELFGKQRDAVERWRDLADANFEYDSVLKDSTKSTEDQFDAAEALAEAYATLTGAALEDESGIQRQIEKYNQLLDTLKPGSELYKSIELHKLQLEQIPRTVNTILGISTPSGAPFKLGYGTFTPPKQPNMNVRDAFYGTDLRVGDAFQGGVRLNVVINRPIATGEQIANELAAYIRRNGTAFLYRY